MIISFNEPIYPENLQPNLQQSLPHPMDNGTILSKSFDIYKRGFLIFLIPFLIANLVVFGLGEILASIFADQFALTASSLNSFDELFDFSGTQSNIDLSTYYSAILFASLISILYAPILSIPMAFAVPISKNIINHSNKSFSEMWNEVRPHIGTILIAGAIFEILRQIGTLFLVIPFIIVSVWFSLTMVVIVEEKLGPIDAMGRSRQLIKGQGWKIFGLLLLVGLVQFIIVFVLDIFNTLLFDFTDNVRLANLLTSIFESIAKPLSGISIFIVFRDQLFREKYLPKPQYRYPQHQQQPYQPPSSQYQQEPSPPQNQFDIPQKTKKFCRNCGSPPINPQDKFCANCGTSYEP